MRSTAEADPTAPPGRPLATVTEAPRTRLLARYIDRPAADWLFTIVVGGMLARWAVPALPLDELEAGDRLTVYVALGAALLAFVTVAFTPLAILAALGDSASVRRIRRHESALRAQFLRSTLLLMGLAVGLLVLGVVDASRADQVGAADSVRTAATLMVALAAARIARLTALFWAVLAAGTAPARRA